MQEEEQREEKEKVQEEQEEHQEEENEEKLRVEEEMKEQSILPVSALSSLKRDIIPSSCFHQSLQSFILSSWSLLVYLPLFFMPFSRKTEPVWLTSVNR